VRVTPGINASFQEMRLPRSVGLDPELEDTFTHYVVRSQVFPPSWIREAETVIKAGKDNK
jgi:hypothetical protein